MTTTTNRSPHRNLTGIKWFLSICFNRPISKVKTFFRYLLIFALGILLLEIHHFNYSVPDLTLAIHTQLAQMLHSYQHSKEYKLLSRAYEKRYGMASSDRSLCDDEIINLEKSFVVNMQADEAIKNTLGGGYDTNNDYEQMNDDKYPKPFGPKNRSVRSPDDTSISGPTQPDYLTLYAQDINGFPVKPGDLISAKISYHGYVTLGKVTDKNDNGQYALEFDYKEMYYDKDLEKSSISKNSKDPYLTVTVLQNKRDIEIIKRLYTLTDMNSEEARGDRDQDEASTFSSTTGSQSLTQGRSKTKHDRKSKIRDVSLPIGVSYYELKNPSVKPLTLNPQNTRSGFRKDLASQLLESSAKCHVKSNYIHHLIQKSKSNHKIDKNESNCKILNTELICECNEKTVNVRPDDFVSIKGIENYGYINFLQNLNVTMVPITRDFISTKGHRQHGYQLSSSKWKLPGQPNPDNSLFKEMMDFRMKLKISDFYFIGDGSLKNWYETFKKRAMRIKATLVQNKGQFLEMIVNNATQSRSTINSYTQPETTTVPDLTAAYIPHGEPYIDQHYLAYAPEETVTLRYIRHYASTNRRSKTVVVFLGIGEQWTLLGEDHFRNRLTNISNFLRQNPFNFKIVVKLLEYKTPRPHICSTSFSPFVVNRFNIIIKEVFQELHTDRKLIYADAWSPSLALADSIRRNGMVVPQELLDRMLKKALTDLITLASS